MTKFVVSLVKWVRATFMVPKIARSNLAMVASLCSCEWHIRAILLRVCRHTFLFFHPVEIAIEALQMTNLFWLCLSCSES